jgi:hypothetical protein
MAIMIKMNNNLPCMSAFTLYRILKNKDEFISVQSIERHRANVAKNY